MAAPTHLRLRQIAAAAGHVPLRAGLITASALTVVATLLALLAGRWWVAIALYGLAAAALCLVIIGAAWGGAAQPPDVARLGRRDPP